MALSVPYSPPWPRLNQGRTRPSLNRMSTDLIRAKICDARLTPEAIDDAARILRAGGLVAFPTETVYGLGADATSDIAVARLFEAKGRPRFNPLIIHVADVAAADENVQFDARARGLATRFWPGPLTLVLSRRETSRVSRLASAGLDTLAIRAPAHPIARDLLTAAGRPVAAPSANRSGLLSPTRAAHVLASLDDRVDLILDGGQCPIGVESSVVDLSVTPPALLRPGGLAKREIEQVIGPLAEAAGADDAGPRSPGQLARHYAPGHPIRMNAITVQEDEALIAFGREVPQGAHVTLSISPDGDVVEAASNLFAMLHEADRAEIRAIAVMPIPDDGLGAAINDRLRRASTDQPK